MMPLRVADLVRLRYTTMTGMVTSVAAVNRMYVELEPDENGDTIGGWFDPNELTPNREHYPDA